MSDTSHSLSHN